MIELIIVLLAVSIIIILLSFFMNDRFKQLEQQIEQLSLSQIQESYQLNKKVKILEEELLPRTEDFDFTSHEKSALTKRIETLFNNGHSIKDISRMTNINEYDVEQVLHSLR
ncbi:hypothetical protein GCM10012290_11260 [Halolactibacillus alkaliphilus]|uniref:Resolvase HTH domain-containing protein n=1 Tax=Halolactibacillus alkaliphilus TaxID=442899 RepID=A0A511X364_9BACI|nr:hypothetical protein [Halolactibacillus alkaliphilus]GEN57390.1 hypothetical protein HAL01_18540 [Halolactibacillus alkaliphilus]GGN69012.1 hypothetical protein GCM10012290_11260 [Halolactibacillus alkaliphilus]SFO73504.1 hypothetical protein SAMN05720591_10759 [Halolactibacillus alkaliphilus]